VEICEALSIIWDVATATVQSLAGKCRKMTSKKAARQPTLVYIGHSYYLVTVARKSSSVNTFTPVVIGRKGSIFGTVSR